MSSDTRQIIVMRKDLGMRRGKQIAQAVHASMAFLTRNAKVISPNPWMTDLYLNVPLKDVEVEWLQNSFTKICVYVNSEEGLLEIDRQAKAARITSHVITDNGTTEFGGVPTVTCLALGPDYKAVLDPITGHLPLF